MPEFEAVPASKILGQMQFAENSLNIVILDACRNNPLSRGMRSASTGLAKMDAPLGSFIAYSTAPGRQPRTARARTALIRRHSPRRFQKPGIAIEEAFRDARVDVLAATGKEQIPWESSSLTGAFQFNPGAKVAEPQVAAAGTGTRAGRTCGSGTRTHRESRPLPQRQGRDVQGLPGDGLHSGGLVHDGIAGRRRRPATSARDRRPR
jgi:uncharacterized caspase-like protein